MPKSAIQIPKSTGMAKVQKLSGKKCQYYQRGRCIKPGVFPPEEDRLCVLIVERQRMGHQTLDRLKRLERFGLTIHDQEGLIAQRYIVDKNLKEMAKISCKNFIESGLNYPACIHQIQTRCLLKMEACLGRCPEYRLGRKPS
jgi:hypothetical protein